MTFNAAIPAAGDSPGIFPAQNQTNMARLQTLIGADHQFNLSAAANDGYHNVVHLTQQAPTGVLAATGRFYAKSSGSRVNAFYIDDAGADYQITPTMPIRAAVNFNGTGANGVKTMRSQFNVTSVTKTDVGAYSIVFTTVMPDNNYIILVTGMRDVAEASVGFVRGDPVYGTSVANTFVGVKFFNATGSAADVLMGNVIILSAT